MENTYAGLVFCVFGVVFITIFLLLVFSIKIVPEDTRLSVYRLGRYLGDKGPGIVVLIPFIDRGVRKKLGDVERIPSQRFSDEIGETRTTVYTDGKVFVSGEEWDATSHSPISAGQPVRVVRMILEVEERCESVLPRTLGRRQEIAMLATIRNLDYVILLCEDLNPMRVFYHETLGFPIYRDLGGWLELRVGAVLLTLRRRGRPYDGRKLPDSAGVQLAFRVAPADVDSCYMELLQKQVDIIESPRDQDYGHRTLFFKDPEGNILEIYADI